MKDTEGKKIPDNKLRKSCHTADGVTYKPKSDDWDTYETYTLTKAGKPRRVKSH